MSPPPAIAKATFATLVGVVLAAFAGCSGDLLVQGQAPPFQPETSKRFVAINGNDLAAGSLAQPWRTVAHGLSLLQPGQTLYLRGGTYNERNLRMTARGAPEGRITVRNMPGETAVIDGSLPSFRLSPAGAWLVHDAARSIYRSQSVFPGLERAYAALTEADGEFRLVPYSTYASLAADGEDYSEQLPYYAGPGVFWNPADGRIYARLVHGRYQTRLGHLVPAVPSPVATPLVVFGSGSLLTIGATSTHLVLEGLTLRGAEQLIEVETLCQHITVRNCDLDGGRYEILVRGSASHLVFDGLVVDGHFPPWVARSDVKRPSLTAPAHYLQGAALELEGRLDEVEVVNCRFTGLFDAIDTTHTPVRFDIHHNRFSGIRDDVFEVATAGYLIDFHHNHIELAAAAISWNGAVAPPPNFTGTKYVHHNVIDTSGLQLYGRDDPLQLLSPAWRGPGGDGMATGRPFGSHDTALLNGPDPWKIYHNTIIGNIDVDGEGLGIGYTFAPFDPAVPHEVMNNVLVQIGDQWIGTDMRVADGSQLFDGNVYHRTMPTILAPLLRTTNGAGAVQGHARLNLFVGSPAWQATRTYYSAGWESIGVDGDPGLDVDRRPSATGPAAAPGINLSNKNWPGVTPLGYRGALPPR